MFTRLRSSAARSSKTVWRRCQSVDRIHLSSSSLNEADGGLAGPFWGSRGRNELLTTRSVCKSHSNGGRGYRSPWRYQGGNPGPRPLRAFGAWQEQTARHARRLRQRTHLTCPTIRTQCLGTRGRYGSFARIKSSCAPCFDHETLRASCLAAVALATWVRESSVSLLMHCRGQNSLAWKTACG